jgi:hypothetical protein
VLGALGRRLHSLVPTVRHRRQFISESRRAARMSLQLLMMISRHVHDCFGNDVLVGRKLNCGSDVRDDEGRVAPIEASSQLSWLKLAPPPGEHSGDV